MLHALPPPTRARFSLFRYSFYFVAASTSCYRSVKRFAISPPPEGICFGLKRSRSLPLSHASRRCNMIKRCFYLSIAWRYPVLKAMTPLLREGNVWVKRYEEPCSAFCHASHVRMRSNFRSHAAMAFIIVDVIPLPPTVRTLYT